MSIELSVVLHSAIGLGAGVMIGYAMLDLPPKRFAIGVAGLAVALINVMVAT